MKDLIQMYEDQEAMRVESRRRKTRESFRKMAEYRDFHYEEIDSGEWKEFMKAIREDSL